MEKSLRQVATLLIHPPVTFGVFAPFTVLLLTGSLQVEWGRASCCWR